MHWTNLILASQEAFTSDNSGKDCCALLMDEMIITNGIVYSASQQKVYGLAEIPSHGINREIYHAFYGMDCEKVKSEDLSKMTYFDETLSKLSGYSATGLTQVHYNTCIDFFELSYVSNKKNVQCQMTHYFQIS